MTDDSPLSTRLRRCEASIVGVVLDPKLAVPDEKAARNLELRPHMSPRPVRVVLYAEASGSAMHAVRGLASCPRCELVVRGGNVMPEWAFARTMISAHGREVL